MDQKTAMFQKLTVVDNVDLGIIKDAFDFVFKNQDLKNIAITGPYGSGKSSVVATYFKEINRSETRLHVINISLAHFCTLDEKEEREVKESILEQKIINQLIHHLDPEKIPQTNFVIKRDFSIWKARKISFEITLFLVFCIYLRGIHHFEVNVSQHFSQGLIKPPLSFLLSPLLIGVALVALVFLSYCFIREFITYFLNHKFLKKFKWNATEIELFENDQESYFDKYLDEVIYLFEKSEADVIIFEDMDRYGVHGIFERLREINYLINIRLERSGKGPLRFFYLLKDDIYTTKDRTKFFDHMIPIVPKMGTSNSGDLMMRMFKEGNYLESFELTFLQDISLYIDDFRLLKNIYNEFQIYYESLKETEIDVNKMLAMIVYKNLFPRDFSDLLINQGMVYTVFAQKPLIIQKEIENLKIQKAEIRKKIQEIEAEHLESCKEVEKLFSDSRFYEKYYYNSPEKHKRLEIAKQKESNMVLVYGKKFDEIEEEIRIISTQSLSQLITRQNEFEIFSVCSTNELGECFNFESVKGNAYFPLLKYLIREGRIDETYPDYMTYFTEESMTRKDKVFLRSITDKKAKAYDYSLVAPENVLKFIPSLRFNQEEVLNFDLLEYLLKKGGYEESLTILLTQLKKTSNLAFIREFLERGKQCSQFTQEMNAIWPELFTIMLNENHFSMDLIRKYSLDTVNCSDEDCLKKINADNALSDYISNQDNYLSLEHSNAEVLVEKLDMLGVLFSHILDWGKDRLLLRAVYERNLYQLNLPNINLMLTEFYDCNFQGEEIRKNYSCIQLQPDSCLAEYVEENMNQYLKCLINEQQGIEDNKEDVIMILNHDQIDIEMKKEYLKLLRTPILKVIEVDNKQLWSVLIDRGLIPFCEENVVQYFQSVKGIDNRLVQWINDNPSSLDYGRIEQNFNQELCQHFVDEFVVETGIENHHYREFIKTVNWRYTVFEFEEVADEKMSILIDLKQIELNKKTLSTIKTYYQPHINNFIKGNIDEYIEVIKNEGVKKEALLEILSWEDVSDDIKIELIEEADFEISILNKEYSDNLNKYILTNYFDYQDLRELIRDYKKWEVEIQDIIFSKIVYYLEDLVDFATNIPKEIIDKLFGDKTIDINVKVDLLIELLPTIDEKVCTQYLPLLNLDEFTTIFNSRGKKKIYVNTLNEKLLSAFKENTSWLDDFERQGDTYKLNRPRKNKNKFKN